VIRSDVGQDDILRADCQPALGGLATCPTTKEHNLAVRTLAEQLPMFLDRAVLDRTGLNGVYEFTLKVELDPQTRLPEVGQLFTGFGMTPSIFVPRASKPA
jgi:uncharacterized protein (TIGR03435 family)